MHHTFDSTWTGFPESVIQFQIFSKCFGLLSECSQAPFCMLTLFYHHLFNCSLMTCMSRICCESYFSKLMLSVWVAQLMFLLSVYNHTKKQPTSSIQHQEPKTRLHAQFLTDIWAKWSLYKLLSVFLRQFRCSLCLSLLVDDKSMTISNVFTVLLLKLSAFAESNFQFKWRSRIWCCKKVPSCATGWINLSSGLPSVYKINCVELLFFFNLWPAWIVGWLGEQVVCAEALQPTLSSLLRSLSTSPLLLGQKKNNHGKKTCMNSYSYLSLLYFYFFFHSLVSKCDVVVLKWTSI